MILQIIIIGEIIVINDGSTDKTEENAKKKGARIITHPQNQGYGFALKNGIRNAKYKTIIIKQLCDLSRLCGGSR